MKTSREKYIYNAFQFTNCAKCHHKNTYSSSHQLIVPFHGEKSKESRLPQNKY